MQHLNFSTEAPLFKTKSKVRQKLSSKVKHYENILVLHVLTILGQTSSIMFLIKNLPAAVATFL